MTDPITSIDITRLRELLAKVGEWPDLGPEDRSDGSFRCPLCDGQGDIDAEFVRDGRREYGNDSWFSIVGVQVYGVGDAMAAMEELLPLLIKHVPSLLDQLDAQAAEIGNLRAERERCIGPLIPKDQLDKSKARVAELEAEVERLRAAMLSALSATRAKVDADCSTECLRMGADEIRLCIRRMDQERVEQTARAERSIACGAEALNKLDAARLRASEQRIRADKAEASGAELEGLLRKHAALACSACAGTGCYLGDEGRAGPCDVCGGTGAVLPADVAAVLAEREGGR